MDWLKGKVFLLVLLMFAILGVHSTGAAQTNKPGTANGTEPVHEITVYKTAMCGCCTQWVDHLEHSGLEVNVITVEETDSVRGRLGVPSNLGSCHTAVVGDYWVEGHVPADLIQKLLREQPQDIEGIAVPGMPPGSPGMEGPNPVQYQVLSVDDNGQVAVYATRDGNSQR